MSRQNRRDGHEVAAVELGLPRRPKRPRKLQELPLRPACLDRRVRTGASLPPLAPAPLALGASVVRNPTQARPGPRQRPGLRLRRREILPQQRGAGKSLLRRDGRPEGAGMDPASSSCRYRRTQCWCRYRPHRTLPARRGSGRALRLPPLRGPRVEALPDAGTLSLSAARQRAPLAASTASACGSARRPRRCCNRPG